MDIWVLPLEEGQEPRPVLVTPFDENSAVFSPDGHWLAYDSDESGRTEVYVRPYPGPGARVQVSTDGGRNPVWARDGRVYFTSTRGGKEMIWSVRPVIGAPTSRPAPAGSRIEHAAYPVKSAQSGFGVGR